MASVVNKIIGNKIYYYTQVSSTNDIAHKMAREGAIEGTVIFADEQSNGRGKMGRVWLSPKGEGILASIILRPDISFSVAHKFTIMAGIGIAKAIKDTFKLPVMIKWPNDILINGLKVCGILTESSSFGHGTSALEEGESRLQKECASLEYLIIGIGINTNSDKASLPEGATSIKAELGKDIDRSGFAEVVLRTLDREYSAYLKSGFEEIISEYAKFACSRYR